MNGMSAQERLVDICNISGLSEDIVRRVQLAEKQSIIKSLKKGERATLNGRVTLRPELKHTPIIGGGFVTAIKVKTDVSSTLEAELEQYGEFEVEQEEQDFGIRLRQIPALI